MSQVESGRLAHEDLPLLAGGEADGFNSLTYYGSDPDDDPGDEQDEEGQDEISRQWLDTVFVAGKQKKGNLLLANDATILVMHFLQLYALIQSLSLRWTWPEDWLFYAKYVFLVNVDIWEFMKMYSNGTYIYAKNHYTPSESVPLDYLYVLLAWALFLFLALGAFIIAYAVITKHKGPHMLTRVAHLQRVYIMGAQLIAIPTGVAAGRLFHCKKLDDDSGKFVLDVANDMQCFTGTHWAYLAPALTVSIVLYVVFPWWLISKTRAEMLGLDGERHEGYLQLKEAEYVHGLDIGWIAGSFHIFASFRQRATHLRAAAHLLHFGILVLYAAAFTHPQAQVVSITVFLFILLLAFLVLRPFRIKAFNVFLPISYLCLTLFGLLGCIKISYDVSSAPSVWLAPSYQFVTLCLISCFWLLCLLIFLSYVACRQHVCNSQGNLWPTVKFHGMSTQTQTKKYVKSIVHGRLMIDKVMSMQPIFSPVHEVSRYIHIVNAHCREAEYLQDPLQDTLWDVLEQLIDAHTTLAPKSLFAESTKESIRQTAAELMQMLPAFASRLAQREYDFVLMRPVMRRMLLKMYILGLFLNGRRVRVERDRLTIPGIKKIWQSKNDSDDTSDAGYYEDMYPPREPLVSTRNYKYPPDLVQLPMDAEVLQDTDNELDDRAVIDKSEQWLELQGVLDLPGSVNSHDLGSLGQLNKTAQIPATLASLQLDPGSITETGQANPGMEHEDEEAGTDVARTGGEEETEL